VWKQIAKIAEQFSISIRIVLRDETVTEWSNWLRFPSKGYGEILRHGPFLIRDVLYLEIDSIEVRTLGRLLPKKEIDYSEDLKATLVEAGIEFQRYGSVFRIKNDCFDS
jgi:hypothetical protein